jgi:hypothetical protein
MFLYKIREQKRGTGPVWGGGLVQVGGEKKYGRINMVQILCIQVCKQDLNLFQECREGVIKEKDEWGEFKYGILIFCKNLYKCINVPPPSTTINKRQRKI